MTWLFLWLLICPLCQAEPIQVQVPKSCLIPMTQYWISEFSWDDLYARWMALQDGQVVTVNGCRVISDRAATPLEPAWVVPHEVLDQVEVWYLESRRDTIRQAVISLLKEGWGELEVNKQKTIVRATWQ